MNAGEMKANRVERFNELLALDRKAVGEKGLS
jgi:hypothetical protein